MEGNCVRLQILMLLMILSGTSGWQRMIPQEVEVETPEFEVVYTDLESGRETRSPVHHSDLIAPDRSEEEDIQKNSSDRSLNRSNYSTGDTGNGRSVDNSTSQLSEAGTIERDKRLINEEIFGIRAVRASSTPCSPSTPCAASNEICVTSGTGEQTCETKCNSVKECDDTTEEECIPDPSSPGGEKYCAIPAATEKTIQTPMTNFGGTNAQYGAACKSVPGSIHDIQTSGVDTDLKKKILSTQADNPENFEYPVCNWVRSRLQCVPNRVDYNNTTTRKPGDPVGHPLGTCKCLLGLGEGAVWIPESVSLPSGKKVGGCYIRANNGSNSKCSHEIAIPSGQIEYVDKGRTVIRTIVGKAGKFCAPGSECRTGYAYVGLRCSCKKYHILERKKGSCKSDGKDLMGNTGTPQAKIAFILLMLPLIHAILTLVWFLYY